MGELRTDEYRAWLERDGLAGSSIDTHISHARNVKRRYGGPDGLHDEDCP